MKIEMDSGLPTGALKEWLVKHKLRLKMSYTGAAWHAVLTHKVTRAEVSALGATVEQAIRRAITLWGRFGGGSYVGGKRKGPLRVNALAASVRGLLK